MEEVLYVIYYTANSFTHFYTFHLVWCEWMKVDEMNRDIQGTRNANKSFYVNSHRQRDQLAANLEATRATGSYCETGAYTRPIPTRPPPSCPDPDDTVKHEPAFPWPVTDPALIKQELAYSHNTRSPPRQIPRSATEMTEGASMKQMCYDEWKNVFNA
jgi:hypothetical protein